MHSPLLGPQDPRHSESREATPPELPDPWGRGEGGMNQLPPSAAAPPGRTGPLGDRAGCCIQGGLLGAHVLQSLLSTCRDPCPSRELGRRRPSHDPGLAETRPRPWAGGDPAVSWAGGDLAMKWAGGDPATTLGQWRPGSSSGAALGRGNPVASLGRGDPVASLS